MISRADSVYVFAVSRYIELPKLSSLHDIKEFPVCNIPFAGFLRIIILKLE